MQKRLYRSRKDQVIGGVCGGIAEYFSIDPILVRLLAVLAVLFGGGGVLAYVVMWVIIPERPKDLEDDEYLHDDKGEQKYSSQVVFGIGLIGLGVYLGVQRYIPWDLGEYFWPAILIVGGIFILTRRKDEA